MKKFQTVDEYMSAVPTEVKGHLATLRKTIRQAAPKAEEVIHYNMPGASNGRERWYGTPRTRGTLACIRELPQWLLLKTNWQVTKLQREQSSSRIEKAIPTELVRKIDKFRMKVNQQNSAP